MSSSPTHSALPDERELRDEALELLRALLRIDTSNPPGNETAAAELLREYLTGNGVDCELVARVPGRANLVARVPGAGEGPSLALLGHTDVVPVEDPSAWRLPPFGGCVDDDGFVWGRGAADMKNELATRAVALARLARSGAVPAGDVLLIAEADEEDGSEDVGLAWLYRERPDLRTDYVLNEGSAERLELADGRVVVPITIGEKAAARAVLTALGEGAATTASRPGENAVVRLAALVARIGAATWPLRSTPETEATLRLLAGPDGSLEQRLARACSLHPLLRTLLEPVFATTVTPTRLHGSQALNVVPARASVECDCRLPPGASLAELEQAIQAALAGLEPFELGIPDPPVGGSVSPVETPLYDACRAWLREHDPEAILVPVICNGFTDSHYARKGGSVAYGLWPTRRTPSAVLHEGVHAVDERVHADDLGYATRFHLDVCLALGR